MSQAAFSPQAQTKPGLKADTRRLLPADTQADHLEVVMTLITKLRQVFSSPRYRPPLLPTVALEIHRLSFQPDVDAARLVAVLEKDAVLAAQVLRVAGSAAFGGWTGDPSLKQAVIRLGLRNLSDVVWEVAAGLRVFRSTHYAPLMEQIRTHSAVCAHICRLVASHRRVPSESAFLCGLLHDIGMAATLLVLADQVEGGKAIDPLLLDLVLRETHQEISGLIAHVWKLPEDVQIVLANHHLGSVDEGPADLTAVVTISEALSNELGFGIKIGPGTCDLSDPAAVELANQTLGLDEEDRQDLERTVAGLASILAVEFNPEAAKSSAASSGGAAYVNYMRVRSNEKAAPAAPTNLPAALSAAPARAPAPVAARQQTGTRSAMRPSWWSRMWRALGL